MSNELPERDAYWYERGRLLGEIQGRRATDRWASAAIFVAIVVTIIVDRLVIGRF